MNKQLKDLSAAIASLKGSYIATINNVKIGTPVFSTVNNSWTRIQDIKSEAMCPLKTENGFTYNSTGRLFPGDRSPSLFLIDPINGTLPAEPEIDWSKVDFGTDIELPRETSMIQAKFITHEFNCDDLWYYYLGDQRPYRIESRVVKLAPHVDIKPEWIKS